MTHRPLDPRKCSVSIDTNALHGTWSARNELLTRLRELFAAGTINLIMPKGVREEILD